MVRSEPSGDSYKYRGLLERLTLGDVDDPAKQQLCGQWHWERKVPGSECMVYKALDDILSLDFAKAFLELWLGMTFLELWLEMEGKHVAIPGCGLVIW
ncbi:hypothetical protein DEO72_LG8g2206 [Vigna unguiculata]|uniref:Uncharacterized protein n=1 Tax=Vigna unguiculata TaxID=3917 RepID=A0A4D6MS14_VIGUN|nr:hypothetical protein DEO72_LG8g2206 [Vigna unguiculata]